METDGMDFNELGNLFVLYGLNVLYALGLMIIGWWLASFVEHLVQRGLGSLQRVDVTVIGFLASIARYGILVFVGVAVLQRFGIQTTSIIAVLGATSLAIGLALQGTLSNLAAGVMLLLFRPFKVGDAVEVGGQPGTVKALSLFTTELSTGENIQVLMPNGKIWGAPIVNKSAYDARRFDFTLELKPDSDIERVLSEGLAFLQSDPRVKANPAPTAEISSMLVDRVAIGFSGWASRADAGAVRGSLIQHMRTKLRGTDEADTAVTDVKPTTQKSARTRQKASVPAGEVGEG